MPITLDGTNGITTPTYGGADTSEYLVPVTAFKNRIINGAMVIDQRNAGAAVTVDGGAVYGVDRWKGEDGTDGVFTIQQSSTAPSGFNYSTKITITTADASLGATQYSYFGQVIEGYNFADLGWGTASAKTVTLSFWVQASVTGTYTASFINSDQNRCYPATFTISSANTWEYKTITVAGDTTGTWLTTNGAALKLYICMGTGSTYTGTGNAWTSSLYFNATGSVNLISTLNATFYITGVQLEVGSTATSFDYRPFGTEFALCQRYYEKNYDLAVAVGAASPSPSSYSRIALSMRFSGTTYTTIPYKITKRATPSVSFWSTSGTANSWNAYANGGGQTNLTPVIDDGGQYNLNISIGSSGSYDLCQGYWASSAEL